MRHALSGGLWLHRFSLHSEPMAHLVSSDLKLLLQTGRVLGMEEEWVQYKPLKDPDTGVRIDAWHWDLLREKLERAIELALPKVPKQVHNLTE